MKFWVIDGPLVVGVDTDSVPVGGLTGQRLAEWDQVTAGDDPFAVLEFLSVEAIDCRVTAEGPPDVVELFLEIGREAGILM